MIEYIGPLIVLFVLGAYVWAWIKIASKIGVTRWLVAPMLVPPVMLLTVICLAVMEWPIEKELNAFRHAEKPKPVTTGGTSSEVVAPSKAPLI